MFAIKSEDGAWVVGSITPSAQYAGKFSYPLVCGTISERKVYTTRADAKADLARTCSLGTFEIVEA